MENKQYKTGKGIEKLLKIKYTYLINIEDFEEHLELLNNQKYYSITAENRRVWSKKFTIKLFKTEDIMKESFEKLIFSFYSHIDVELNNINDILGDGYLFQKKTQNINSASYNKEKFNFKNIFIYKDVIYTDVFNCKKMKRGGYKLKIYKIIKVPFPMEYLSQNTHIVNWDMRKNWRQYKLSIIKGLSK